ncbi:MAG: methyltransferase domain-containing protein [Phycisphaerae bacterium]|nr:methyltransferase domain-containing protein [Phycisphaerae bacterium]
MRRQRKINRQYDRWSKVYDFTFGRLLQERHQRAIGELGLRAGDRVLDLGIGTGMTLDHYPGDVQVVGLDLSAGMLQRAAAKIQDRGLDHVQLLQGDAMRPPLAAGSFDHVLITHVISVVPDPLCLLRWAARLVRPGGRIVIANHFQSRHRLIALMQKAVNPLCVQLGWRSDLSLQDLLEASPLELRSHFKIKALDLWQIVALTSTPEPTEVPCVEDSRINDHFEMELAASLSDAAAT